MDVLEKSFPRGGTIRRHTEVKADDEKSTPKVHFGAVQLPPSKKRKKKKQPELGNEEKPVEIINVDHNPVDILEEGMLVMGAVSQVEELRLHISLPGRLQGQVNALNISDSYTKAMEACVKPQSTSILADSKYKPLKELFHVGELVYGKIVSVKTAPNSLSNHIDLSLKPIDIHSQLNHIHIQKGFVFNGAIQEVLEHGYIIETGVKSLRCFLPREKVPEERLEMLSVGELVHLKVIKVNTDVAATTCTCRLLQPEEMSVKSQKDTKLDYLMPLSVVKFHVTKVLKKGLQGTIMEGTYTAFVNEYHLSTSLSWLNEYEADKVYDGRIMYVMPLTKVVYISLNTSFEKIKEPEQETPIKDGEIIKAAVVHHSTSGGVVLILKTNFKGFISYRTIRRTMKGNFDQADLLVKYAAGTKHTVRVIKYHIMDDVYVCSNDYNDINEKNFTLDDVKAGDFVTAKVLAYNANIGGYNLQVGRLRGKERKSVLMFQIYTKFCILFSLLFFFSL